jgi:hypothetical protein
MSAELILGIVTAIGVFGILIFSILAFFGI